jgi:hypothetical protein
MKVISVEANISPRKVYVVENDEQQYLEFTEGIEVLPAMYYESDPGTKFYFKKKHEDGEPGWKGGGYECVEENGARRAFHLDSLIVHPKYFKRKEKAAKILKRTGTGKRGRPKMDPALKKTPTVYVKTGGKRGRPAKDPSERKSTVYVKTGGKRGRPKKSN